MYPRAGGLRYTRFLSSLHASHLFDWYLEIGCRDGASFAPVRSKTIAVDPFFRTEADIIGPKPRLHIFQTTSDDFFAGGFLKANKIKLSFSFLDGLHQFEFLLRDFMNTEAASAAGGVIALHDCVPFNEEMSIRDHAARTTRSWAGDVWKLLPILAEYRPDLKIEVLDCRPTGLVLVSNLNPRSTALKSAYAEILARYESVTLAAFGPQRFADSFTVIDARAYQAAGHPTFAKVRLTEDKALSPVMVSP